MTPSLRERLRKELIEFNIVDRVYVDEKEDRMERELNIRIALHSILLAVKEALPEKHDYDKCPYCAWPESCVDWNDAIEEMERRLGLGTESTNKKP